ncbi:hypothetical protein MNEG_9541, partial [Monoraphidium neglectum]
MIAASCLGVLRGAPLRACLSAAPLAAAAWRAAAAAAAAPPRRGLSSANGNGEKHSAIYITDSEGGTVHDHTPLILGLLNYFERHLPFVGYFAPFGGGGGHAAAGQVASGNDVMMDRHLKLICSVFKMKCEPRWG